MDKEETRVRKMAQVKCEYCGRIVELANIVRLNPDTEEYEYACVNCARRLELDLKPGGDSSYFI
jgi:DNA-directed RNA polymerase subunit RPC12/RpoP